jgi:hypothetical protein
MDVRLRVTTPRHRAMGHAPGYSTLALQISVSLEEGAPPMTTKATLHQIIEELPESELVAAGRFLAYLRDMADPVRRALLTAPWDDEPETEDERQAVQEARDELARGEVYPLDEVRRELGL